MRNHSEATTNNGTTPREVYYDGPWTDGLISAAQEVAHSTGTLCEAANETVQGNAAQEKLIVSAKTVSANTTTLVMACQVKADMNSNALKGLKEASGSVKAATNQLVSTAQEYLIKQKEVEEQDAERIASQSMKNESQNDRFKQELMIKEQIAKTQKLLQEQYEQLKITRTSRYKKDEEE